MPEQDTTPAQATDATTTVPSSDQPSGQRPQQAAGWPNVKTGMHIKLHQRIKDVNPKGEERERTQIFEGLVIRRQGGTTAGATITVRKQSFGIWVEKIFPVHLPSITNIEVVKQYKTRRGNLGYLRTNHTKRLKEKQK